MCPAPLGPQHRTSGRARLLLAGVLALMLSATACAGGSDEEPERFSVLTPVESGVLRQELGRLARDECVAENKALPYEDSTVPQNDVTQRTTLLASQSALPVMFAAPTAGIRPEGDLAEKTLDYEKVLKDLGVLDEVLPSAVKTVKAAYGGRMASLPFQYNIEGIWYNKRIFDRHRIPVPQTWDELTAAADKLQKVGVQPFTASGEQAWTLTRYISGLAFRELGPEALQRVIDGKAKLTDLAYVRAASRVADLGAEGYFGKGLTSRDIDTTYAQFLNGDAAMLYMGSWLLANIHDEEQNAIGPDAIGFMPFPAVRGGRGDIDQYPANTGSATALGSGSYNDQVGDWLRCIAQNYGSSVLRNQAVISGFETNRPVNDIPPLTRMIQQRVSELDETVLWFEALMDPRTGTEAMEDAPLLMNGEMTPKAYMENLQRSIESS